MIDNRNRNNKSDRDSLKRIRRLLKAYDVFAQSTRDSDQNHSLRVNALSDSSEFKNIMAFMETFPAASIASDQTWGWQGEWNPFSQRPLIVGKLPFEYQPLQAGFSEAQELASSLLTLAHDSAHVAIWEPFFCGKFQPGSLSAFVNISFQFEAFSLWFSDIVITPLIREKVPDGETVETRSSTALGAFHAYRVLKSLKISPDESLGVLMGALSKHKGKKVKSRDAFARDLHNRLGQFYHLNLKSTERLYQTLNVLGMWDEFYNRFCRISGLPSIVSRESVEFLKKGDTESYCRHFYKKDLLRLSLSSVSDNRRVRLRRALQSRAYYGFCIQHALRSKVFFSRSKRRLAIKGIASSIDVYLKGIELQLRSLAESVSETKIFKSLAALDLAYDKEIWSRFNAQDVWIGKREQIFFKGQLRPPIGLSGYLTQNEQQDLLNEIIDQVLPTRLSHNPEEGRQLLWSLSTLSKKCINGGILNESDRKILDNILLEPSQLPRWSVALNEIRPSKSQFREILFIYE
jgi:hypothetical protein